MARFAGSSSRLLDQIRSKLVPPVSGGLYKGQSGRICVIGGCREYTGAPYFAAMTVLKCGADISHVVCTRDASIPIKCYSPELIVHGCLRSSSEQAAAVSAADENEAVDFVGSLLKRVHGVIIGPGLGRDSVVLAQVARIVTKVREMKLPMVLDGDALFLISQQPQLISGYENAILTPNINEYRQIAKALSQPEDVSVEQLAAHLRVTIVQKAEKDVISHGSIRLTVSEAGGSPRRCGGQGDVLAGLIGTLWTWAHLGLRHHHNNNNNNNNNNNSQQQPAEAAPLQFIVDDVALPSSLVAAYGGCFIARQCAAAAFKKHKRSMLASNLLNELPAVLQELFPC